MTKYRIAAFGALTLATFGFAPSSFAGDDGKDVKATKNIAEQIKQSCISGDLGVTITSEYISRGLVQVNQGVIAEPYLDLYFKLYEGTGFINKVQLNVGLWSSIHSHVEPPGNTDSVRNWFEFDYTAGVAVTFARNFTLTSSYIECDSPANAFDTQRSLNFNLAYDDTDLLGKFALHPHVTYLREITAQGFLGLQPDANYYELGIAPSYTAGIVTLTVPIIVGLGSEGFYNGDTYGYFSAGLQASVPLGFIPECLGKWTFSGGYTYYNLGDEASKAFGITLSHSQHVFQGAIGLTF